MTSSTIYSLAKSINSRLILTRLKYFDKAQTSSRACLADEQLSENKKSSEDHHKKLFLRNVSRAVNRRAVGSQLHSMSQMVDNLTWTFLNGPLRLRLLAKAYNLLGSILPYNAEVTKRTELEYKSSSANQGEFIIPSEEMLDPTVSVYGCDLGKMYSIFLIDSDSVAPDSKRSQFCLWSR